jgi:hypothetical protein
MRIAMRTARDGTRLTPAVVNEAFDSVGGERHMFDVNAGGVAIFSTAIFSSEDLTDDQLDEIWNAGKFWVSDLKFWEGEYNNIISKINKFVWD